MGFITKKRVMWGGICALLLLGGAFLLWDPEPGVPSFGPIEWGQEKDYAISTDANGGTTVRNTREKYSFVVPAGWRVSKTQGVVPEEFFLDLLSPDAVLSDKKAITQGCRILLETVYDEQNIMEIRNTISSIKQQGTADRSKVIMIDGIEADRAVYISKEDAQSKKGLPIFIIVRAPLSKDIALEYRIHALPEKNDECLKTFSEFSDSVRFK